FYIDFIEPEYNILKLAGSSLGYKHSSESLAKLREAMSSDKVKAKLSKINTGENNPNFGKSISIPTKALISQALSGENNSMYGKTGENHPKSKKVFVYSSSAPTIISHEFVSYSEAANYFNCKIGVISYYIKTGNLFKKEWILS